VCINIFHELPSRRERLRPVWPEPSGSAWVAWGSGGVNTGRIATDSPILEGLPVRISLAFRSLGAGQIALPCNVARRGAEHGQTVLLTAVPHRG
jgi:hypothetical protein